MKITKNGDCMVLELVLFLHKTFRLMNFKFVFKSFLALCALALFSCSEKDNAPSFSSQALQNAELVNVLKAKGFTFNEKGQLELNDLAQNTRSLDLSGTKLKDLTGLDVFPNLHELKLANNGYGPVFDFAKLPTQITGVDLTNNDIYDFEGLVSTKVENDEVKTTILRPLAKLYLPATAKYNVEDLMPFYTESKAEKKQVDMQMMGAEGQLKAYNTIREIPDEYFRKYLKTIFSKLFVNETSIDISKPMALEATGQNVMLNVMIPFEDIDKVKSVEGIEYFINNPFYKPFGVALNCTNQCSVAYIAPRANIKALALTHIDTDPASDFTKATSLAALDFTHNNTVQRLDFSQTLIGNQKAEAFDMLFTNILGLRDCKNLQEVVIRKSGEGILNNLAFIDLPKLKQIDLSFVKGLQDLMLLRLPNCKITYPTTLKYYYDGGANELVDLSEMNTISLTLSEDVYKKDETKAFITKYNKYLGDGYDVWSEYNPYKWK